MAKRHQPEDITKTFQELESENPRAAITVGGSLLEYALEQAILSRLREPQTKTEGEVLFRDKGILGTFYEKIWASYFLKIIGPVSRQDIDLIRVIRNEVAHNMNPVSFDTPEIASRCRELKLANESIGGKIEPPDLRAKFLVTVKFYTANLLMRAGDSNAEIAEAFKSLAPYLNR
jgi:hypothetical protein